MTSHVADRLFSLQPRVKNAVRWPLRLLRLEGPIHADLRYLREIGWLRSYRERQPVDREGAPIPWYTYSAIEFIGERLPADATVFEFGCGNSTLWFAARAARVVAVDPNEDWTARIKAVAPANVEVVTRSYPTEMDGYLAEIGNHDIRWDVVAIDSVWRAESSRAAVEHLSERGVIVWDNSLLPEFAEHMRDTFGPAGFRELPFGGLVPMVPSSDRTSILYRPGNLLGI